MTTRTVVVAHPSADLYGSDRQLLETIDALVESGVRVVVAVQGDGPLVAHLVDRGAQVRSMDYPVLRKSALRPLPFLRLLRDIAVALPRLVGLIREVRAEAVLVNTITIPWWLLAARLARRPAIGHVHEAEQDGSRLVRTVLALPNVLATRLVVNSEASARALLDVMPVLRRRVTVVYNGVPSPPTPPEPPRARTAQSPVRVVVVARLSPRKGIDVAVEALAGLVAAGHDASLEIAGTVFEGYEWFETELRDRAERPDLAGRVTFLGYVAPVWPVLARADIVLVPSRVEPFGNTAVEAMLARRPLIASRTQGLAEIVTDGRTGLQVPPGDAAALTAAMIALTTDPAFAARLADAAQTEATARFGADRYRRQMRAAMGLTQPEVTP